MPPPGEKPSSPLPFGISQDDLGKLVKSLGGLPDMLKKIQDGFKYPADGPPPPPPLPFGARSQDEVTQVLTAQQALLDAYRQANDDARQGKPISGGDFRVPEKEFDRALDRHSPDSDDRDLRKYLQQYISDIEPSFSYPAYDARFRDLYIKNSPHREDTAGLPRKGSSEKQLIVDVLRKNRGFVIGDFHTQDESLDFLARNMKTLKDSGVDTLYIENNHFYDSMNRLRIDELERLARDGTYGKITLHTPAQTADTYNVTRADDVDVSHVRMLIEAKKHDVRVVNIDKSGMARSVEITNHRISSTNYTWTENIRADHARWNDGREHKFVVFGGLAHFVAERGRHGASGLVDEAEGLPTIAYTNGKKGGRPEVRKGTNPNGPDFYLQGGEDYDQTENLIVEPPEKPVEPAPQEKNIQPPSAPSWTPQAQPRGFFRRRWR